MRTKIMSGLTILKDLVGTKEPSFNAVIEGRYEHGESDLHFKLAHLDVHLEDTGIDDGESRYRLYGITEDFRTVRLTTESVLGVSEVDSLAYCKGVVVPYALPWLGRARSVVMRDGRVFVNERDHLTSYVQGLSEVVKAAGIFFTNEEWNERYLRSIAVLYHKGK